jgi:hypothetical protein
MVSSKENSSRVIPIAIIVLGVLGGYIFYSMLIKGSATELPPPAAVQDNTLFKFKDLSLDFSIFDDLRFKSLKIFGESPVQPGQTGRTDIFAPF